MIVAVPREHSDTRNALIPDAARILCALEGIDVVMESGVSDHWSDTEYIDAGASIEKNRKALIGKADVILRINPTEEKEIGSAKKRRAARQSS